MSSNDDDSTAKVLVDQGALERLLNRPSPFERWWNSLSSSAKDLLADPRTFIVATVVGFIYNEFVAPVLASVIGAALAAVSAVQILFLGPDKQLSATGGIGLADLGLVLVGIVVDSAGPAAAAIIGTFDRFNLAVASIAAEAGIAAPLVVTGLRVAEVVAFLWGVWYVIRVVDVPLINLGPLLKALSAPVRLLVGVFR